MRNIRSVIAFFVVLVLARPAFAQTGLPPNVTGPLEGNQGHRRLLQAIGFAIRNEAAAAALRQGREAARARAEEEMRRTGASSAAVTVRTWEYRPEESVFSEYRYTFGLSGTGGSDEEALDNMLADEHGTYLEGPPDGRSLFGVMVFVFGSNGSSAVYSPGAVAARVRKNAPDSGSTSSSSSSSGSSHSDESSSRGASWKSEFDSAWSKASDPSTSQADREKAQRELSDLVDEARKHSDTAYSAPDLGDGSPQPITCGVCGLVRDLAIEELNTRSISQRLEKRLILDEKHFEKKGRGVMSDVVVH